MPLLDLSSEDFAGNPLQRRFAPMKVMAVMMHPENATARDRLLVSIGFRGAASWANQLRVGLTVAPDATDLFVQVSDPNELIDQALQPVITGFKGLGDGPSFSGGHLAGAILLKVLHLHQQDATHASLELARTEISNELQALKAKRVRPKDLKLPWNAFRSASHLWAAYIRWQVVSEQKEAREIGITVGSLIPTEPVAFKAFLALAETLRERGERIKHKNAATPILKAEQMWRLPPEFGDIRLPELGADF